MAATQGDQNGNGNGRANFHLRPEVSYGHIISTLGLLAGLVAYSMQTENRITALEVRQEASSAAMQQQLYDIKASLGRIENRLEGKMDRSFLPYPGVAPHAPK